MDARILEAIEEEIRRLERARALLQGAQPAASPVVGRKGKRKLSARARQAIAEAQRKRWAKAKRAKAAAQPA